MPSKPSKHQVRVVIREVTYQALTQNMLGQDQLEFKTAYGPGRPEIDPATLLPNADVESAEYATAVENYKMGELIELFDDDYIRLRNGGAVVDEKEAQAMAVEAEEEVLNVTTASIDDLARWIKQEQPKVQEVVDASGGEPDLAQKLLEAEAQAQDGEPRKGVLEGLSAVIGRG